MEERTKRRDPEASPVDVKHSAGRQYLDGWMGFGSFSVFKGPVGPANKWYEAKNKSFVKFASKNPILSRYSCIVSYSCEASRSPGFDEILAVREAPFSWGGPYAHTHTRQTSSYAGFRGGQSLEVALIKTKRSNSLNRLRKTEKEQSGVEA